MQDVEDRLRRTARGVADGIDTSSVFERIEARRERHLKPRRAPAAPLVVLVIVAVVTGTWGLFRVFEGTAHRSTREPTDHPASVLPPAGGVIGKVPLRADLWAAWGGTVFGVVQPPSEGGASMTIGRQGPDGALVQKKVVLRQASSYGLIAATSQAVYLAGPRLVRIDAGSLAVTANIAMSAIDGITATDSGVWVTFGDEVVRVDPETLQKLASRRLASGFSLLLDQSSPPSVGAGGLWVATGTPGKGGQLVRMDPETLRVISRTPVPFWGGYGDYLVANARSVWIVRGGTGVVPVDPSSGALGAQLDLPGLSNAQAWDGGLIALLQPRSVSSIILVDPDDLIVARSDLSGDVGGWFVADGLDAWFTQDGLLQVQLMPKRP